MAWDHIGKPLSTADVAASVPNVYQKFRITTGYKNQVLREAVCGIFFYNNPSFGTIKAELWSDDNGGPGRKIAESLTFSQAECNTDTFAYRIMSFVFPKVSLKKNTYYYLTIRPSSYTGDASSHIAWRQSWPDPQYRTGVTITLEYAAKFPYDVVFTTDDL